MGAVWLAEDPRLGRQVALKMVLPANLDDAAARARLMKEARAAAALNHPHIATVHDVLEVEGRVVIVFEYVEGETLHARILRGALPAPEAVEVASQIAKALTAAHAQGIIHRDLKPANVIIGSGGHVKVLDFGIARTLSFGTTQTLGGAPHSTVSPGGFIGTPAYAAPEQMVSAAVDQRADLYALGVMLFEMITGRRPFDGTELVQLATSKLGTDAPRLSSTGALLSAELETLVAGLLARKPDDRPASAAEVLSKLRAISGAPSTHALAVPSRRGVAVSIAATALLIAISGIGVWQLSRFPHLPPASDGPPVVAVLPLVNVSGDSSKDYVAAGIAESLISSLASLPSVTVLSRSAVTEARGRIKDEMALAKDLGATYLVNGSVQQSGDTLKISLNLVRPDHTVAWGESVEGAFDRIFDLQSRLASALTNALVVRLSASDRGRINAQPTTSPQALSAYWRGVALMERFDMSPDVDSAIASYEEAITLDPQFALAHAALGRAYWEKYSQTRETEWTAKALNAGATALRIDATLPEVRLAMAAILNGTGQYGEATKELMQALVLRPNYDDARRMLGQVLARQGRIDEAVVEFQKAIALRPTAWQTHSYLGLALLANARYEQAIAAFAKVTELQPENDVGFQQLGTAYQAVGRNAEAKESYQRALTLRPSAQLYSNLGTLEYSGGQYAAAVDAYRAAIKLRPNSAATHRNLGDALAKLNRLDEARTSYQEAVRLAEVAVKINPADPRALAALAVYAAKAGRIDEARQHLSKAFALANDDVEVLFRAAVVEAIGRQADRAISYLERAVARGYSVEAISTTDEFEWLRSRPAFAVIVNNPQKERKR